MLLSRVGSIAAGRYDNSLAVSAWRGAIGLAAMAIYSNLQQYRQQVLIGILMTLLRGAAPAFHQRMCIKIDTWVGND
jgi:hypothetical protein